ncbi:MAG: TIGR01777 family oxidoreductase [Planctomycetota bacterium]
MPTPTPPQPPATAPARVAIAGMTGMIGSALARSLTADGTACLALSSSGRPVDGAEQTLRWPADTHALDAAATDALSTCNAVVNLAGENIVGRWTAAKKRAIRTSRIDRTTALARALADMPADARPGAFVACSAIGIYPPSGDAELDEAAPTTADTFLGDIAQGWEAAANPAADAGIRVVHPRIGIVLAKHGGALKQMLPIFKLGLGGRLGNGNHYWSWIAIDDLVAALRFLIANPSVAGPVNLTAPSPATNRDFTAALGRVLGRPAVFPVPAFAVRLAFNGLGDEELLASRRVVPRRLLDAGFAFNHPELTPALHHLLR